MMTAPMYKFTPGTTPVLVSIPHAGTAMQESIRRRLTPSAQSLPDTDWHLDRLYEFVTDLGAAKLVAMHSRYVIDLNRPPVDERLYDSPTTGLMPSVQFDGNPVYIDGAAPQQAERSSRIESYYRPYHDRMATVLTEMRRQFGFAVLFDAHSIRSRVPRLFDGDLPDLNMGTNCGQSADESLESALLAICQRSPFSTVVNERFRGGYITRHYGNPTQGIHAVQLEMPLRLYMHEDERLAFDAARASQLLPTLIAWVEALIAWRPG
jgi:N-formylglutamate deformylase